MRLRFGAFDAFDPVRRGALSRAYAERRNPRLFVEDEVAQKVRTQAVQLGRAEAHWFVNTGRNWQEAGIRAGLFGERQAV